MYRLLDKTEPIQREKILLALNIDAECLQLRTEADFKRADSITGTHKWNYYLKRREIAI